MPRLFVAFATARPVSRRGRWLMSRANLLDAKQAAKWLNITEDQLVALVYDGEISYINVGRGKKRPRRRFAEEDIEDFKERRRRREACLSTSPKSHVLPVRFPARRSSVLPLQGKQNASK